MIVGEWGKPIVLFLGADVSAADTVQFEFTKPDGTTSTKTATAGMYSRVKSDGTTSASGFWAEYVIESGFVDQPKKWHVQAIATWTGVKVLKSPKESFWVRE